MFFLNYNTFVGNCLFIVVLEIRYSIERICFYFKKMASLLSLFAPLDCAKNV